MAETPTDNPWRRPVAWGQQPRQAFRASALPTTEPAPRVTRPSATFLQDSLMVPPRPDAAQQHLDLTPKVAPRPAPAARPAPEPVPPIHREPTTGTTRRPEVVTRAAPASAVPVPETGPVEVPVFAEPRKDSRLPKGVLYGGAAAVLAVAAVAIVLTRGGDTVPVSPEVETPILAAEATAPASPEATPIEAGVVNDEGAPAASTTATETVVAPASAPSAARAEPQVERPAVRPVAQPTTPGEQPTPPPAETRAVPASEIVLPVVTPPPAPVQTPPVQAQPQPRPSDDATISTRPESIPDGG